MCSNPIPCVITPLHPSKYPPLLWDGAALGRKAACEPATGRIWIEKKFWDSLTEPEAKLALVLHEIGHAEGARCESCADRRAGQLLAGLSIPNPKPAVQMFLTRLQNRDAKRAAQDVAQGYAGERAEDAADAGACPGTVDEAGLCKVQPLGAVPLLSFHAADKPGLRAAKARARGIPGADGPTDIASQLRAWHDREHALRARGLRPADGLGSSWRLNARGLDTSSLSCLDAGKSLLSDCDIRRIVLGADSVDIAAELAQVPKLDQSFKTSQSDNDPLSKIVADAALEFFPDAPELYAKVIAGIINSEAAPLSPRSLKYDPKSFNHDSEGHPYYGLMQVGPHWWPDITMQDGVIRDDVWDARQNVRMGAQVLRVSREAFPDDLKAQVASYNGGVKNTRKAISQGRDPDYATEDGNYARGVFGTLRDWGFPVDEQATSGEGYGSGAGAGAPTDDTSSPSDDESSPGDDESSQDPGSAVLDLASLWKGQKKDHANAVLLFLLLVVGILSFRYFQEES